MITISNLTIYDKLLIESDEEGLITKEKPLQAHDGLIFGNRIAIRESIETITEKACVLSEELGHYYTSTGNILDQEILGNRKQEQRARMWAYNNRIGLDGIIAAYKNRCTNLHEVAEFLEVTESFLKDALQAYKDKYGICVRHLDYVIYFEPILYVAEMNFKKQENMFF